VIIITIRGSFYSPWSLIKQR